MTARKPFSRSCWIVTLCLTFIYTVIPASGDLLTASFTSSGATYNGKTYDLSGMTGKSSPATCKMFSPIIQGGGLYFKGLPTLPTADTAPTVTISISDARINNAPIKMDGYLPVRSTITISYATATMQGTTTVFDLRGFVPQGYVSVYILDTTATWTSGGGAVLTLAGTATMFFKEYSGVYVVRTHAIKAKSMVQMDDGGMDLHNSLFTVDYGVCESCSGPFFNSVSSVLNSRNGIFRLQNCTHRSTTNQPFYKSRPPSGSDFMYGPSGNIIFSSIVTDGNLFDLSAGGIYCKRTSQFVMQHIKAKGTGVSTDPFSPFGGTCEAYMGNFTLNGVKYDNNVALYDNIGLRYTKIISPFGMVVVDKNTGGDTTGVNQPSAAYCTRDGYSGVYSERVPTDEDLKEAGLTIGKVETWTRARCTCNAVASKPYCSLVYDPLLYPVGFTYQAPKCTTDPVSCQECKWGEFNKCEKCMPNYKFDTTGANCIKMVCTVANCKKCMYDTENKCDTCNDNYKLSGTACTKKTCAQAPCTGCSSPSGDADVCATCSDPYKVEESTGQCTGCIAGYKRVGTTCVKKVCSVANCQTCVFDTEDQCDSCNDNYKVGDTASCELKTCAQEPCKGCTSSSGDDDVCVSCSDPYVFEESTGQCTGCIAGYKRDGALCVEKECLVENCTTCVFDTEDRCDSCNDNYKVGKTASCELKTCAQEPCKGCTSSSGDDDTCTSCGPGYEVGGTVCVEKECLVKNCSRCVFDTKDQCETCGTNQKSDGKGGCTPMVCTVENCTKCVDDTEDQCETCGTNLKTDEAGECIPMVCSVENCTKCVDDTEDQCETCGTNLKPDETAECIPMVCSVTNCTKCVENTEDQCAECEGGLVTKNGGCGAKEGSGGLPLGAIIGIVIGVVVLLILLVLLLLFLCCRKNKAAHEYVDHITGKEEEARDTESKVKVDVTEESEVTVMDRGQREGMAEAENPLNHPPEEEASQTAAPRKKTRRARSVRNNAAEIADIDLDYMYDNKNEIVEE